MKTKRLLEILEKVLPAVEKKALLPQYDHFVFYRGNISTYNGKLFFSHPIDFKEKCSVKATDFLNVIKSIDGEDVDLTLDGNNLLVTSEDVTATLSTEVHEQSVVFAISSMNLDKIDWDKDAYPVPADFIYGVSQCLFSVSKDAQDIRNLHNIHIIDNVVESGDGYRCSEYIMENDMTEMLIPSSAANVLVKSQPELYCQTDGWVHFLDEKAGSVVFSLRTGEGDFPDVGALIERVGEGDWDVRLPDKLLNVLGQFASMSDNDLAIYKHVRIDLTKDEIKVSTDKDGLQVEKRVANEDNGSELSFYISSVFLSSIMEKTNIVRVNEKMNVAIFKAPNFSHIITLPVND